MLLYLVKHSRPDISNVVRKLSKCMDGATPDAFKELKRVIKFVLDTKTYGLKIQPTELTQDQKWTVVVYSDSHYAGDQESHLSVTGYIIFVLGVAVCWRSEAQEHHADKQRSRVCGALGSGQRSEIFFHNSWN